jgi:hypothetical protein
VVRLAPVHPSPTRGDDAGEPGGAGSRTSPRPVATDGGDQTDDSQGSARTTTTTPTPTTASAPTANQGGNGSDDSTATTATTAGDDNAGSTTSTAGTTAATAGNASGDRKAALARRAHTRVRSADAGAANPVVFAVVLVVVLGVPS